MPDKFLKRFEKLENISADALVEKGLRISKRFECLEVGDKKIALTITDKISPVETAADNAGHKIICPYCGMENGQDDECCSFCKRVIKTKLSQEFQGYAKDTARCECGVMNQNNRRHCWFCGRLLAGAAGTPDAQSFNTIIINVDGKEYRSDDKNLPADVVELMNRIREEGYKKEIIDKWMRERNAGVTDQTSRRDSRLQEIRLGLILRVIGLIVAFFVVIFQFRMCARFNFF